VRSWEKGGDERKGESSNESYLSTYEFVSICFLYNGGVGYNSEKEDLILFII